MSAPGDVSGGSAEPVAASVRPPGGAPAEARTLRMRLVAAARAGAAVLSRRPGWVEGVVVVLAAVSVIWTLDVGGFRGMGDNGDYGRVAHQLQIALPPGSGDTIHHVVSPYWVDRPRVSSWREYPTSLVPVLHVARALDSLVSDDHRFDLRFLGLLYLAVFLGLVYGLVRLTRPLNPWLRVGLAAFGLLVLTDFAYVGYFHSLFSEPLGFLGVLGVVTGALYWAASGCRSLVALALLTAGGVVLATSKSAYASVALTPAAVLLVLGLRRLRRRELPAALVAVGAGAAMLVGSAWSLAYAPPSLQTIQLWEVTYLELLPHAPDRVAAVRELGLDPRLVAYTGQVAHGTRSPLQSRQFRAEFPQPVPTRSAVLRYYASHPTRFAGLLWRGRSGMSEMRPPDIGTTTRAGPDGQPVLTDRRATWSSAVHHLGQFAIPGVGLVLGGAVVAPFVAWRRDRRRVRDGGRPRYGPASRGGLVVLVALGLTAMEQYVVVLLADARWELVKHLYLFHLMVDLALLGLLAWGGTAWLGRRAARDGAGSLTEPVSASATPTRAPDTSRTSGPPIGRMGT